MDFDEERNEDVEMADREADELKPSTNNSSVRKLFVGSISKKTTEESFREYFSKFGQVAGSKLLCDKDSGMRQGIGFVSYADPKIVDKVLEEDHSIDGKKVAVKKALDKTTRIYVGDFPLSLTQDELKEYFSYYGSVVDHCIVMDKRTGQSRGFGFVSFDKEETVEEVLSNGHIHELCGKRVTITKSKPKRDCIGHTSESQIHHGRSGSKSYYSDGGYRGSSHGVPASYGRGRGYGNSGNIWNYGGNRVYRGGGRNGVYAYGNTGAANERYVTAYYGRGRGYGYSGRGWNDGGNIGYGGGGSNGACVYGNTGAATGRFVPAYYGRGRGYGNSGNIWKYEGNGGYGGGGTNDAYAYDNTGAANRRYHPY